MTAHSQNLAYMQLIFLKNFKFGIWIRNHQIKSYKGKSLSYYILSDILNCGQSNPNATYCHTAAANAQ